VRPDQNGSRSCCAKARFMKSSHFHTRRADGISAAGVRAGAAARTHCVSRDREAKCATWVESLRGNDCSTRGESNALLVTLRKAAARTMFFLQLT
jgi:hypothetical protein